MPMDLTGRRFAEGKALKETTPDAVRATRNALIDQPLTLVKVPGGATYAIPKEVYDAIVGQIRNGR